MKTTLVAAGVLVLAAARFAAAQQLDAARPADAEAAFVGTLAVACNLRPADWGDWVVQWAAVDVQMDAPDAGPGWFTPPEPTYFDKSLGEVVMAAGAGSRLHDRYGALPCIAMLDARAVDSLDHRRAGEPDFPSHQRYLTPTGGTPSITPELLDASFLAEAVTLARSCGLRPAAWGVSALEVVDIAILTEADKKSAERTGMAEAMRHGQGAKRIAVDIALQEFGRLRQAACGWVKKSSELSDLDAKVVEWRKLQARTKAGDWSGLGGIK